MTRQGAKALPESVVRLLQRVRYEVIPAASVEDKVLASVPKDVTVTVTASPTKGLDTTLDLAVQLAGAGYRVVPHISARLVVDKAHLSDIVARLAAAGIDNVFVPAGDAVEPAGSYEGSLPLLADLTALGSPFGSVGITGYPETHPSIDDDITVQAMWDKRAHATYIVSNLCFDAKMIGTWLARVRKRGVTLPVHLGLAGPVETTKLLSMATKIGVGESTRFLTNHVSWFMRMASPGGYSPEKLLRQVSAATAAADPNIAGLHVFTFNQVAETEAWRQALLERALTRTT
ncbi:MAG: methylenetetrahydrofolate reductase [Actinomycetota bacterium]|nr:methylenetetrahydrofolate reductase [Actinomycetota bacterium]